MRWFAASRFPMEPYPALQNLFKAIQFVLVLSTLAHAAVPLSSFNTVLSIQRDGSVVAVERIVPETPQNSFVWSTSTEYPGRWGIRDPRVVDLLEVTSGYGQPLAFEVRRLPGRMELQIETGGASEIRIVYSVRNAVQFLADRDELRWYAGGRWRGDTGRASFFVQAPSGASPMRTQAYLSGAGLLSIGGTDSGSKHISFETPGPIRANNQLLLDVVLPKGELNEPAALKQIAWFVRANPIVLLPLGTFIVMLVLHRLKRLPRPSDRTVAAQYEPPQGLTPAEIGLLVDDRIDPRDVTATFLDLVIRGYIRLEPCKPDDGTDFEGSDFKLQSMRSKDEWYALPLHERTLLFHTFYGGEWTKLSSLSLRFYSVVPLMRQQVVQLLRTKGMYWTDPEYAESARIGMLLAFFGVALAIQLWGVYSFASSWMLWLIVVAISGLIVHYSGRGITSKTRKGLHTYEQVLGFQLFLDSVERDRLQRLPGELFEKFLPYALALGVEHHWERSFAGVSTPRPEWVTAIEEGYFDAGGLIRVLAAMARESAASRGFASVLRV